jgi:D-beta-D-heptose 7-phosphate kinase/D-beta-D-heptose 1-phosphate adenosyltransferase
MKLKQPLSSRIYDVDQLKRQIHIWKLLSKKVVFTNGVFDILHQGHVHTFTEAASFGDILIVGINADASVKRLKGDLRPVNSELSRAYLVSSLIMVDAVIIFSEDTPLELIKMILPDTLVKGGDYTINNIVGAKEVMDNGGSVEIIQTQQGFSTTGIINKISETNNK